MGDCDDLYDFVGHEDDDEDIYDDLMTVRTRSSVSVWSLLTDINLVTGRATYLRAYQTFCCLSKRIIRCLILFKYF